MADVVMVIAAEGFRDEEYALPRAVLEAAGVRVETASNCVGRCVGRFGLEADATLDVATAAGREWDAVVFVGGPGADVFFEDPAAHALARRVLSEGGVVAAICIAPATLARAGLLDGVRATAFPTVTDDLVIRGARWSDAPVVTDGRIVTGNGPEIAREFGIAITDALGVTPKR